MTPRWLKFTLGALFDIKIARYRAFKVARISVLHYNSGLGEAKKGPKKAKIGQKPPPE